MREYCKDEMSVQGEHFEPYTLLDGDRVGRSPVLILCDHASNALPPEFGTLGLPAEDFARHIAFDPGSEPLARALAARLDAPALLTHFSRLLIDCNRGTDDPTLVMRLSDGSIIPVNRHLTPEDIAARIARFYDPYHRAIDAAIDTALTAGIVPMLLSIHTFTPVWRGIARPWHAGILWDRDPRLARLLIDGLSRDPALVVGDNEPYRGWLKNDCLYRHGTSRGLAHALIEIRQDLLTTDAGVTDWCARIATIIEQALDDPATRADLTQIRHHGSRADQD